MFVRILAYIEFHLVLLEMHGSSFSSLRVDSPCSDSLFPRLIPFDLKVWSNHRISALKRKRRVEFKQSLEEIKAEEAKQGPLEVLDRSTRRGIEKTRLTVLSDGNRGQPTSTPHLHESDPSCRRRDQLDRSSHRTWEEDLILVVRLVSSGCSLRLVTSSNQR